VKESGVIGGPVKDDKGQVLKEWEKTAGLTD